MKQSIVQIASKAETISLEDGENIIGVPFEDVEKMIKKARKSK